MQGLADGYFVLPYTISNYLADWLDKPIPAPITRRPADRPPPATGSGGLCGSAAHARPTTSTASSARSSRDYSGMERTAQGLEKAMSRRSRPSTTSCSKDLRVTGDGESVNQERLQKAGRVEDFFELGMLM